MSMLNRVKNSRFFGIPPWIFIGAVIILLPIFTIMTTETVHRQKENNIRLLLEKGAALIRSFEAGTRTGMMGGRGGGFRLQRLLFETAQQDDIVYLMVADQVGTILAHNDTGYINQKYGTELDLESVTRTRKLAWRIVVGPEQRKIFEVYQRFSPVRGGMGMHSGRMMFRRNFPPGMEVLESEEMLPQIIFIGLDMTTIEEAQRADIRHSIIMGITLLLIGFAGIIFLFLAQSYRATKDSLSRIKAFSDNLVENMPIGLVAIDTGKKVASLNYVAGSILQVSLTDVIGEPASQVLPEKLWALVENLEMKAGVVEKEIDCPVASGRMISIEVSATLLEDENENSLGYVLLFKDLSEVRTLRKEIARNQRLATVGRLAAGVAHEIRNPLSSIKGFATYFKERYRDAPEDQHIAGIMIQEVDRLNRVVSQLLEFARPVAITKKSVLLPDFIRDSLKLVEGRALEKNIQIKTDFAAGVKAVFIDPDKMNQVFLNLYLNAIEAMGESGGTLMVHLEAAPGQEGVEIRVGDTGVGIREEDLAQIFDPYFTTKSTGTGLGLAIAHKILEVHKGGIKIDSQPGKGTVVTFTLPYSKGSRDE